MSGILATLRSAGGAAIFATLDQETIPAAPSAVAGDAINATSATLTLVDNSGNETGFEWQLETPPGAGNWTAATGATNPTAPGVTSFIATGLTGATDYTPRARARGVTFSSAYVTGAAFGTDNVAGGGGIIPPPGTAPIVSTHPVAQMVTAGSAALFSVVASGTAPLTYQWRFIGANIAGATLSTYSRQTSLGDDGGTVSVVVTNSFGSVTSNNAALTVGLAPFITVPPSAQSVNETSSVTFAVAYAGTVPVVVQWLRNGVAIAAQAGNSYTFTPQLTDSGATFSARLTNAYGTATSSAALLTVNPISFTLVVEDGTAIGDADSYITLADANLYHANRGNTAWAGLTTLQKEGALRKAVDYMLQVYRWRWAGERRTDTQSLDWPRSNVPRMDRKGLYGAISAYYSETFVPQEVQRACAELALRSATGDLAPDLGRLTTREKVDVIEIEFAPGTSPWVRYRSVDNMLTAFFMPSSGSKITLTRG